MGLRIRELVALTEANLTDAMLLAIGNAGVAVDDNHITVEDFIDYVATALNTETMALTKVSIDASAANNHITELDKDDMKAAADIAMSQLANLTTANRAVVSSAANKIESSGTITTAMLAFLNVTAGTLTASKAVVVDAASKIDAWEVGGDITHSTSGRLIDNTPSDHNDNSVPPGGDITAVTTVTRISTGPALYSPALTNGAEGQLKWIRFDTDGGGNVAIAPTNFAHSPGATKITLDTVGDNVLLFYRDAVWHVIGGYGHVVG